MNSYLKTLILLVSIFTCILAFEIERRDKPQIPDPPPHHTGERLYIIDGFSYEWTTPGKATFVRHKVADILGALDEVTEKLKLEYQELNLNKIQANTTKVRNYIVSVTVGFENRVSLANFTELISGALGGVNLILETHNFAQIEINMGDVKERKKIGTIDYSFIETK